MTINPRACPLAYPAVYGRAASSTSEVNGTPVTTETKRVFWLDTDGNLILDRSGTPASEVPTMRSVYRRK